MIQIKPCGNPGKESSRDASTKEKCGALKLSLFSWQLSNLFQIQSPLRQVEPERDRPGWPHHHSVVFKGRHLESGCSYGVCHLYSRPATISNPFPWQQCAESQACMVVSGPSPEPCFQPCYTPAVYLCKRLVFPLPSFSSSEALELVQDAIIIQASYKLLSVSTIFFFSDPVFGMRSSCSLQKPTRQAHPGRAELLTFYSKHSLVLGRKTWA